MEATRRATGRGEPKARHIQYGRAPALIPSGWEGACLSVGTAEVRGAVYDDGDDRDPRGKGKSAAVAARAS
jgi:hypothetical protein